MLIKKLIILILLTCNTHSLMANNETGFDEICNIYTEALNSNFSKQVLSQYIFENISKRVQSKDALDAHGSVFQLPPKERYTIFKQGAEYSLKTKWDCAAVKKLMH